MTDSAFAYKGALFNQAVEETGIKHRFCRPYRPQTNGNAERFNRTLLDEWASGLQLRISSGPGTHGSIATTITRCTQCTPRWEFRRSHA